MTDVPDRPEDPLFASPGPGAAEPAGPDGPGPHGYDDGTSAGGSAPAPAPPLAHGSVPPEDPTAYGARWGAPGGPTPADRAAARRRARVWVFSVLAVVVLVVVAAAGGSWLVERARERAWEPVASDVSGPTEAHAVQLVLGSCVAELPDSGQVGTVEVVPCRDEHVAQVLGRHDSTAAEVWPGTDVLQARAARACTPDLLGPQAEGSGVAADLTWVLWTPSEESWAAGDRSGLCVAVSATPRTGTLLE